MGVIGDEITALPRLKLGSPYFNYSTTMPLDRLATGGAGRATMQSWGKGRKKQTRDAKMVYFNKGIFLLNCDK